MCPASYLDNPEPIPNNLTTEQQNSNPKLKGLYNG